MPTPIRKTVLIALVAIASTATGAERYEVVKLWPEAPQGWHFYEPWGVGVDKAGHVYVGDTGNYKVKKFDSDGRLILEWGRPGQGDGQFTHIAGIKVDDAGVVYVVDWNREQWEKSRIQKFSPYGRFLGTWERSAPDTETFELPVDVAVGPRGNVFVLAADYAPKKQYRGPVRIEEYSPDGEFVTQWGSEGTDDGQFIHPSGIAVDVDGCVYVADNDNRRIQKFDPNGVFMAKWGGWGWGDGFFNRVQSVALGNAGQVYVLGRFSIQKFTREGAFLTRWRLKREGKGRYRMPWQIAVDASGSVYVSDPAVDKVWKFDDTGNVKSEWASAGHGDSRFADPGSIAIDPSGRVFVCDYENDRIKSFDANGESLSSWGEGFWYSVGDIAADASGNLYVAGGESHEVQKFDADGELIARWGTKGTSEGQFEYPWGIAVGPSGNVYVADSDNSRIQKFTADGKFLTQWGSFGPGDGQFKYPLFIRVDGADHVWVGDQPIRGTHRIQEFDTDGKFLQTRTLPSRARTVDLSGNIYCKSEATIEKYDPSGELIGRFNMETSGNEKVNSVSEMCVDASGCLYVAQDNTTSIKKFDAQGELLASWTPANTDSEGNFPSGADSLAVDSAGNVYASTQNDVSIWKLTPQGKLADTIRMQPPSAEGRFMSLSLGSVAVDASGKVMVLDTVHVDYASPAIQTFEADGTFVSRWVPEPDQSAIQELGSAATDSAGNTYVTDTDRHCVHKLDAQGKHVKSWGSKGDGDGQFNIPADITVDGSGHVYVCDRQNCRIQKFDSHGRFLAKWGKEGSGEGEFYFPAAVAVDKQGFVYVADTNNHRIQKFTAGGRFLTEWGEFGEAPGQLNMPGGIAADDEGNVYVSDSHNHRIQKFAPVAPR
jgi:DNA-binding beta-propeller fold protein YncE